VPTDLNTMQNLKVSGINQFYLEFERLVHRVECATSHYQVLGLENTAKLDDIKIAYRQAVYLVQEVYTGKAETSDKGGQAKAMRVLRKMSVAFSVLSNFGKRTEYDNLLFRKRPGLVPIASFDSLNHPVSEPVGSVGPARWSLPQTANATSVLAGVQPHRTAAANQAQASEPVAPYAIKPDLGLDFFNRRRYERVQMSLPVRIVGHDRIRGKWDELAETFDVSRVGAAIRTNSVLRHGTVVQLTLPLPQNFRTHALGSPAYSVYAITRRIGIHRGEPRTVGLEFLGEQPPAGYLDRPWAAFRTQTWSGPERRREQREERSEVVGIRYLDKSGAAIRQEVALTENISPSGARIFVKGAPSQIEMIRVANLSRSFESLARVCDRYIGNDGFERICLQFIDKKWVSEAAADS
jgi:curved DNA-binding protein CbpA